MSQRMMSICKKPSCNNLITSPGYCEEHKTDKRPRSISWEMLDKEKTVEQIKFYNSYRWKKKSLLHRTIEPLCRECKINGKITPAELTHHNPDLNFLLKNNLNPFDDKYLESSCTRCHLKDLRKKKDKHRKKNSNKLTLFYVKNN